MARLGDTYIYGYLYMNDNTIYDAKFGTDMLPDVTSSYNIGSTSLMWQHAYFQTDGYIYLADDQQEWIYGDGGAVYFGAVNNDELFLSGATLAPVTSTGLDLGDATHLWDDLYISDAILWDDGNEFMYGDGDQLLWGVGGATELVLSASALYPNTDAGLDLGLTGKRFATLYVDDITVTNVPWGTGDGTVTQITDGNGMADFTITTTGSIVLGTPGNTTQATTSAVTALSHTHAWSHTSSANWDTAYSSIYVDADVETYMVARTVTAEAAADWIIFKDATDNALKMNLVSAFNLSYFNDDLVYGVGTVTSVAIGNGLTGTTPITGTGTITLGAGGTVTQASTNAVSASSHTHAWTHTSSSGWDTAASHVGTTGANHTYIDQSVATSATPSFTGLDVGAFTGSTEVVIGAATDGSAELGLWEISQLYGFRWVYNGASNIFYLYNHNNSAGGAIFISIPRAGATMTVYGDIVPDGASTRSLGSATAEYANIYMAGYLYLDIAQQEWIYSNGSNLAFAVAGSTVCRVTSGGFQPFNADTQNLGGTGNEWANMYLGSGRYYMAVDQGESMRSDLTNIIFTVNSVDELLITPTLLRPNANAGLSLGSDTYEYNDIWIDGTGYFDAITMHGGIATGGNAITGGGAGHDQFSDFLSTEHFTMLDEDAMGTNSATQAATQQSIKAYVDASGSQKYMISWTARVTDTNDYMILLGSPGGAETSATSPVIGQSTNNFFVTFWVTPVAITITDMGVGLHTVPGTGDAYVFTVRDDQSNTSAVVTISGAVATNGSWSGSVDVAAGSVIDIFWSNTGAPTSSYAVATIMFEEQ